jgi:uncharacterized protein (TIGR01777 family)
MKVVLFGGSGQLGGVLVRAFQARGDDVVVVSRSGATAARRIAWDGKSVGPWASELEGADVVVNLAGRSVNCRYTAANRKAMFDSRVESTRAVGAAIAGASRPPRVWLQMSTATIYSHRFDAANDEATGVIGGSEPDAPAAWKFSIDIAQAWEHALETAATPRTRKVALRSSLVLNADRGGIFDVLLGLTRAGLGGPIGDGAQYVSWLHERDFVGMLDFLVAHEELDGAVILASPHPLPQREFMAALRAASGTRLGLPATRWMTALGAFFLRTETELTFKSRRVVPRRLLDAGYRMVFPEWPAAARELVARYRAGTASG